MRQPRLLILGAGRARGDAHPLGVQRVTLEGRVLDWQLAAFEKVRPEVEFVGGYDIAEVIRHFPRLTYHYNPDWASTGPVASLALALKQVPDGDGDLYVAYSDVLLREDLVGRLAGQDERITVALDSDLSSDPVAESLTADSVRGEFIGVARVPAGLVERFKSAVSGVADRLAGRRLSELFAVVAAADAGLAPMPVDATGLWGHAEHSDSVARFILGTKAATLNRLRGRLRRSTVLPLQYFTRGEWLEGPGKVVAAALTGLAGAELLIVRSSARDEDGFARANAGKYHSELGVLPEPGALSAAIEKVFASYSGDESADEVLVQPQLTDVAACGVAFTRFLGTGSPYRVLSYDESGDTTAITSGASDSAIKLIVARGSPASALAGLPDTGRSVLAAIDEIERCLHHDALDVEFSVAADGSITTLQVRPLMIADATQDRAADAEVADALSGIHATLAALEPPPAGQVGTRAVWSVMADWNPAEIIGLTPGPLALDLYRHLITDSTWATQRREVGYRGPVGWPLVRAFGGQAFVDVRASVNSFIPAALPETLAARIVDDGLDRLRRQPTLHDKVEFAVVPTCVDFDFEYWSNGYRDRGALSEAELDALHAELSAVTRNIIARSAPDLACAEALEREFGSHPAPGPDFGGWLRSTLESSRTGALTFAHLARAGFVAAALLRSAVRRGLLTAPRCDELMASVTTIGGVIATAAWSVRQGKMPRTEFIARFGHLRPGTYDVTAPAYRDRPEAFVDPIIEAAVEPQPRDFAWTPGERSALETGLSALPLGLDADGLLEFIRTAVAGREYAKFVFTKYLSTALDGIASRGQMLALERSTLECLPLHMLLNDTVEVWGADSFPEMLRESARNRERLHRLAALVSLPPVLTSPDEIYAFAVPCSEPNFITGKSVRGQVRVVGPGDVAQRDAVAGRIVAIRNADPGFDYLFALGIAGLVTAYGGPNSHMAIRASEFRIPAVIGVGARAFERIRDGGVVEIDGLRRRWTCVS